MIEPEDQTEEPAPHVGSNLIDMFIGSAILMVIAEFVIWALRFWRWFR